MEARITATGSFKDTMSFLEKIKMKSYLSNIEAIAQEGVERLKAATPVDTGVTADSWGYTIDNTADGCKITWTNSNSVDGIPIVVLLHYGHGTRQGGYVEGRDFINPALEPLMKRLTELSWEGGLLK